MQGAMGMVRKGIYLTGQAGLIAGFGAENAQYKMKVCSINENGWAADIYL